MPKYISIILFSFIFGRNAIIFECKISKNEMINNLLNIL